jgi:hypothetical protein
MSTKWIWVSLCVATLGAAAAPSRAAETPSAAPAPKLDTTPIDAAHAAAAEPDVAQVDAALLEADRRFVAGDLHGALDILEPVCDASARPDCAFSLAAIHHGLGHCREARTSYRRYREIAPAGEHTEEVRAALEEVETRCGNAGEATPAVPGIAASSPERAAMSAPSPALAASPGEPRPLGPPPRDSIGTELVVGSFAISGAAALTSVVFGILAARSANRCARADVYDRAYSEECEDRGPRYQGLWQGFALASGGFLGIGLTLWWLDSDAAAAGSVSGGGVPALRYQGRF